MPSGNSQLLEDLWSYLHILNVYIYIYTYHFGAGWFLKLWHMYVSFAEMSFHLKSPTFNLGNVWWWCSKWCVPKVTHTFRKPPVIHKPGPFFWRTCHIIYIYIYTYIFIYIYIYTSFWSFLTTPCRKPTNY